MSGTPSERSRSDEALEQERAVMEEGAKLLWRYHDWLRERGYVLCERASRSSSAVPGSVSYWPVRDGADLLARFVAWSMEHPADERDDA